MSYGSVRPPHWSEVWILGGGPSAKDFDLSRAYGHTVLAVNDGALRHYKETEYVCGREKFTAAFCSIDPYWIREHMTFLAWFRGERFLAPALDTHPECKRIAGATYLKREHHFGLSEDPSVVCTGGNSGYAAINVAYHKRAEVIHLVGFDMNGPEDKYRQWVPRFRTVLPQLEKRGTTVINENPESAIDAFEKREVYA